MLFQKKIKKIKKTYLQKKSGFTLVETLIAMLLFTLVVVMISGVFMTFLKNYATTRNIQRSTESAQFAMNLMAKTIRTSQVSPQTDPAAAGQSFIQLYDFSQGQCLVYLYNNVSNNIQVRYSNTASPVSIANCDFNSLKPAQDITSPAVNVAGFFTIIPSVSSTLGVVRIVLSANKAGQTTPPLLMQTSVSLRNFGEL